LLEGKMTESEEKFYRVGRSEGYTDGLEAYADSIKQYFLDLGFIDIDEESGIIIPASRMVNPNTSAKIVDVLKNADKALWREADRLL
jgi:hypothetical protein